MISSAHRFIFLHAPKTGGNSIQSALLPFSDDHKVLTAQQDGKDRFGVKGPITQTKHMNLQNYADALGDRLQDYRTILTVRDPVDRALSTYFSPRRLLDLGAAGDEFTFSEFAAVVAAMHSLVTFVTVGGTPRKPDYVLRFERLGGDFSSMAENLGLPPIELPTLNRSGDLRGLRDTLRHDRKVRALVVERFAEDYEYFANALSGGARWRR